MSHQHTIDCVEKAEKLILEQNEDAYRYATLQLRMGIEYLFYELVPLYKDELPENILTRWRPQQILDAILDCDPNADQDSAIAFVPSGTLPNPEDFQSSKAVSKSGSLSEAGRPATARSRRCKLASSSSAVASP